MPNYTSVQQEAIANLSGNMAVSAGAGSGKTRVLVERYIHILRQGEAGCENILAVTFTKKAAKEMKERIREQIAVLADLATGGEEREIWNKAKQQIEYAPISTIHSLCARILRDNPVEAILDPNFTVLDQFEAELLLEKAVNDTLRQGIAAAAPWLDQLAFSYGKSSLSGVFINLFKKMDAEVLSEEHQEARLLAPYQQAMSQEVTLREKLKVACSDLVVANSAQDAKTAHALMVGKIGENWEEIAAAIDTYDSGDGAAGSILQHYLGSLEARSKDRDIVKEVREYYAKLQKVVLASKAVQLIPYLHQYLELVGKNFTERKAALHVVTYNDLEKRTWQLLQQHAAVCRKYRERIGYIMVDEFQDTNDLQRQIMYLLSGGDADRLQGSNLFVVGDAKQSIYRFRGADVSVFDRVCQDIDTGGGKVLDLDTNFRSIDGLLKTFNDIFAVLMGTPADLVRFKPLQVHRQAPEPRVCVELRIIDKTTLSLEDEAVEKQAQALAQRIREMVDDRAPVLFGDIAILFCASKNIEVYGIALQRLEIPYYVLGGRGFYSRQEICDMLNLLRVVGNCYNETALIGVLRSPFFMLSDETLFWLKVHGESIWRGLGKTREVPNLPAHQQAAAEKAWQVIAKLRGLCGFVKVADLLKLALAETGYAQLALTQFMGLQIYANIQKLIEIAESFHAEDFAALNDFLQYVEKLISEKAEESEEQIESESGNTVKLMTVHKAKGLQFPVVFLPELERRFHEEAGVAIYDRSFGLGLKVPVGDGTFQATSVYEEAVARERKLSFLEMKRLLYVAATRAQDYLVLYGIKDKNKIATDKDFLELNTWLQWLGKIYGFQDMETLPERLQVNEGEIAVFRDMPGDVAFPVVPQTFDNAMLLGEPSPAVVANLAAHLQPVREQRPDTIRSFSASSLLLYRHCPRAFFYRYLAGVPELEDQGTMSMSGSVVPGHLVGLAVHRFCETVRPGDNLQERLALAVQEAVPVTWVAAVAREAEPLVRQYRNSALFQDIGSSICRQEWRFNYHMQLTDGIAPDRLAFNGSIDCLLTYPDGSLGIIDYKTDVISTDDFTEKIAAYRWQIGLYALAAQAISGHPLRDARLYFVRIDQMVSIPVDQGELSVIRQELADACRTITNHRTDDHYQCNTAWCCYCNFSIFCPGRKL